MNSSAQVTTVVPVQGKAFEMEISDCRVDEGRVWITTAPAEGLVDRMLSVCMEVGSLDQGDGDLPVAHVHFDSDDLAFSVFRRGDTMVIRPGAGVTVKAGVGHDGTRLMLLE